MGMQVNIPVIAVIMIATLASTSSSMAGGLILYFQGLESLEASMAETSKSEVEGLRSEVLKQISFAETTIDMLKKFVFSHERIKGSDSNDWTDAVRSFGFAQVAASEALGVGGIIALGVPQNPLNRSAFGVFLWGEKHKDGSNPRNTAWYNDQLPPENFVVANNSVQAMLVPLHPLQPETGYLGPYLVSLDFKKRFVDLSKHDPRDGPWEVPEEAGTAVPPVAGSVMSSWLSPQEWVASDGFIQSYTNLDAFFPPPPPPHPWSTFKAVALSVTFKYQTFQPAFDTYKAARPDTTAMLVNRRTGLVYASTAGGMVPDWCQSDSGAADAVRTVGCALRVTDLSAAAQDAFRATATQPMGSFVKQSLGGEDHFLRREDANHLGLEMVWLRPTSSVEGKVQEALVLLIIFTVMVLAFDLAMSTLEVVFIAMPMRQLSSAIAAVGDMETEAAAQSVARYESSCVMVSEMRRLMNGMTKTVHRLEEFKAFMPDSILAQDSSEPETSQSESASKVSRQQSSIGASSRTSAMTEGTVHAAKQQALTLHLHMKPVTLLLVNVVAWWKTVEMGDLLNNHSSLVGGIMTTISASSGVLDSFSGDRFLAGYNTAKNKHDHVARAMGTACELRETLEGVNLSSAVATGKAHVGNSGTKQIRRFSILAPIVPWVVELEAFGKGQDYLCVTDDATSNRIESAFNCRIVDAIASHKRGVVAPVVEVVSRIEVQAAEWMYELEQAENDTKYDTYLRTMSLFIIFQRWDLAKTVTSESDELIQRLPKVLGVALQNREFKPLDRRFERTDRDVSGYQAASERYRKQAALKRVKDTVL